MEKNNKIKLLEDKNFWGGDVKEKFNQPYKLSQIKTFIRVKIVFFLLMCFPFIRLIPMSELFPTVSFKIKIQIFSFERFKINTMQSGRKKIAETNMGPH